MDRSETVRTLSSGADQRGLRNYNERLILSILQRNGQLTSRDIAQSTDLSAQTISVILRKLEADGLILKGKPVKGKVGKPSIPIRLNPDGALSIGIKLGRRGCDVFLTNLTGKILFQRRTHYKVALPSTVFEFLRTSIRDAESYVSRNCEAKICGIGMALPFEIWQWREAKNAQDLKFDSWRDIDFKEEVGRFTHLPVFMINDATSACWAEHVYGRGKEFQDFAYFFVSTFIGGGVVINQNVYEGSRGNAGALGSLRVNDPKGHMRQLVDVASIHVLERRLEEHGFDPRSLWTHPQNWDPYEQLVRNWMDDIAAEVTQACLSVCAVIDFEAVFIDGAFPENIRRRLVEKVRSLITVPDSRGLILPQIEEGTIGAEARAVGAACGPIFAQYFLTAKARNIGQPIQAD